MATIVPYKSIIYLICLSLLHINSTGLELFLTHIVGELVVFPLYGSNVFLYHFLNACGNGTTNLYICTLVHVAGWWIWMFVFISVYYAIFSIGRFILTVLWRLITKKNE